MTSSVRCEMRYANTTARGSIRRQRVGALCVLGLMGASAIAAADEATTIVKSGILYGNVKLLGFRSGIRIEDSDTLREGESKRYEPVLYRGTRYAFFAAGDQHIRDLDIYIYDMDGNLLAHDDNNSDTAITVFAPRSTGQFKVIVKNYRGDAGWYHLAMALD
jgi:hypothetical protein